MILLLKILYFKWRFNLAYFFSSKSRGEQFCINSKKRCFVFLAANYGNLGDVAITYAQELFLRKHFQEHEIIDVPINKTLCAIKTLKKKCNQDDVITLVGGGNMSDLYFDIELLRQMVVNAFPNNRIISFPQTMFFSNSLGGKYLKYLAKKTYSRHKQLNLSSRERWSYEVMKSIRSDCKLLPDIVMILDRRNTSIKRHGVTLCLRNDAESNISLDLKEDLMSYIAENYDSVSYDTHIGRGGLTLKEREYELNKIWTQFSSSEWVITDRLHGMIFAFITGTPCIVLPNNNYKIEGSYSWLKDCGFIYYMDDFSISQLSNFLQKTTIIDYNLIHYKLISRIEAWMK